MANLKRLSVYCTRHLISMPMHFAGWAGPYKPKYKCPLCGKVKIYYRPHQHGRIRRIR